MVELIGVPPQVLVVEQPQEVPGVGVGLRRHPGRPGQVRDRLVGGERGTLEHGGQEGAAPVGRAVGGEAARVGQDDVRRQVVGHDREDATDLTTGGRHGDPVDAQRVVGAVADVGVGLDGGAAIAFLLDEGRVRFEVEGVGEISVAMDNIEKARLQPDLVALGLAPQPKPGGPRGRRRKNDAGAAGGDDTRDATSAPPRSE